MLAIKEAIQKSGEAQISEIENSTDLQIQEIMNKTRIDVEKMIEEAEALAVSPAFGERAKTIHHARLKALHKIGNERETLVDVAIDQTKGRLAGVRSDTVYPEVMRRLTIQAIFELQESLEESWDCELEADPRDQALLDSILSDEGLNVKVKYTLKVWGGLIAKSRDNRVMVINTLEARLERATPFLRRYLAAFFEREYHPVEEKWMA
ncbi:MAG: hypothetical protein GWO26_08085 [Phycisphaerae bacterium]|nr:hypothetical protein [Phycisphaerae bacterium]